jgi:hypothetical protein
MDTHACGQQVTDLQNRRNQEGRTGIVETTVAVSVMRMPFIDRTVNHPTRNAYKNIRVQQRLRDKKGKSKPGFSSTIISPEKGEDSRTHQTPHVSKHDRTLGAGSGSVVSSDHTAEPDFTR